MAATLGEVVIGVRLDDSQLKAQLAATKGKLASLGGSGGAGGAAAAATITAQQRVANLTKTMGTAASAVGRWGRTMTWRATMPLTLLGAASVKAANTFEQSFARINAIAGKIGMSTEDAQQRVKELAVTYGQAPQELADALYFVASAGVKASDVMSVVEQSAKGAATGLADSATIAQMLTTVMNNYGESGFTAEQGLNVLTEAIKLGKAEPQELADSLGAVIPMASQLGVSFASMAGAVAQGTNAGLSAARAATGLRFILGSLQRPTNMAKEVLKNYGLTVEDVQDKFKELGATGGIQYLADVFDTTTTKGKEAFAVLMGGQRGLIIANALIGENYKNARRIDDLMKRSPNSGAADKALAKATATSAFQFKKAMAELKVAAIELGNVLVPILTKHVLPVLMKIVKGFQGLSDGAQKALVWSGIFLALAGPAAQLLSLVLRLGQGLGIIAGFGMRVLGIGGAAVAAAAAPAAATAVGPATVGSLGWAMPSATAGAAAATSSAAAAGSAFGAIVGPILAVAVEAAILAGMEKASREREKGNLEKPGTAGKTGLAFPGADPNAPKLEPGTPGFNPWGSRQNAYRRNSPEREWARERDQLVRTFGPNGELQVWTKQILKGYKGITDQEAQQIAIVIRKLEAWGGTIDMEDRKRVQNLLEMGDVNAALKILKDNLKAAARAARQAFNHLSDLAYGAQLLGAGITIGSTTDPNRFTKTRNLAEHGAVIGLAGGGFLVTRPTFIRGNVLTGERRKKEAVIPLEDVRGKRILAGAMSEAMSGASRGTVVVNVAGKVERPEDIRRELDWWMRSRGL